MRALLGIALALGIWGAADSAAPAALTRTTYLGGSKFESAYAITEAPNHTLYVVGTTNSTDIPVPGSAAQPTYGGGLHDIYVAHFSANLSQLLGATYIGGDGDDCGYAITFDSQNDSLYVAGSTTSVNFPDTTGGAQPQYAGNGDTILIRLTPSLSRFQATYLGGSGNDTPSASFAQPTRTMAIGISPTTGRVYVAGDTDSTDFPGTAGGAQATIGGGFDSYVAEFTPNLKHLLQATYLGGSGDDFLSSMVITSAGNIYVAGATDSSDFPHTATGAQTSLHGPKDAFVAALKPNLAAIANATYLGGSQGDLASGLAVASQSNYLYVVGSTNSHDFPKTFPVSAQPRNAGKSDAFVAALALNLRSEAIATYLGGSDADYSRPAIAVSQTDGSVYVGGTTISTDFPDAAGGVQTQYPGGTYASFVAHLTSNLTQLIQCTYFGGSSSHTGIHGILIDPSNQQIYVAGGSGALDLPNTQGAYDASFNGGTRDIVVSTFDSTLTPQ